MGESDPIKSIFVSLLERWDNSWKCQWKGVNPINRYTQLHLQTSFLVFMNISYAHNKKWIFFGVLDKNGTVILFQHVIILWGWINLIVKVHLCVLVFGQRCDDLLKARKDQICSLVSYWSLFFSILSKTICKLISGCIWASVVRL